MRPTKGIFAVYCRPRSYYTNVVRLNDRKSTGRRDGKRFALLLFFVYLFCVCVLRKLCVVDRFGARGNFNERKQWCWSRKEFSPLLIALYVFDACRAAVVAWRSQSSVRRALFERISDHKMIMVIAVICSRLGGCRMRASAIFLGRSHNCGLSCASPCVILSYPDLWCVFVLVRAKQSWQWAGLCARLTVHPPNKILTAIFSPANVLCLLNYTIVHKPNHASKNY